MRNSKGSYLAIKNGGRRLLMIKQLFDKNDAASIILKNKFIQNNMNNNGGQYGVATINCSFPGAYSPISLAINNFRMRLHTLIII